MLSAQFEGCFGETEGDTLHVCWTQGKLSRQTSLGIRLTATAFHRPSVLGRVWRPSTSAGKVAGVTAILRE